MGKNLHFVSLPFLLFPALDRPLLLLEILSFSCVNFLNFYLPTFLLPFLLFIFLLISNSCLRLSPPYISIPLYSVCRSVFARTRCFNSMCFVLHYTVVCHREPGRVSPDVNVVCIVLVLKSAQCCIAISCTSCVFNCCVSDLSCK